MADPTITGIVTANLVVARARLAAATSYVGEAIDLLESHGREPALLNIEGVEELIHDALALIRAARVVHKVEP